MTAQETFERLLEQENKLHEAATLAEVASHPGERVALVEGFLEMSASSRRLLDSLLLSCSAMPPHFGPLVRRFEDLRSLMARREVAWAEVLRQFSESRRTPTTQAMNTVAWNCRLVDPSLDAIVRDLEQLSAASALEAALRSVV